MSDTAGFYKLSGETLFYGPTAIHNAAYELHAETHEEHDYPIDGWTWFDSREEACAAYGYVEPVEEDRDDGLQLRI